MSTQGNILLCPGQGAQAVGMGHAWSEASPAARAVFEAADAVLGDTLGGIRFSTLCFDGPADILNRTNASQPALYTCGVAAYAGLCELGVLEGEPVACAGLSLGEYTALHLAGVFSFEDGLRLVAQRGQYMQEAAEASSGSMLALTGASEQQAEQLAAEAAGATGILVCANFNAPGQIVLSGDRDACERAASLAGGQGLRATPLVVAGAFHSPHMEPAAMRMGEALEAVAFSAPACPVLSNVTARPHDGGNPDGIKRLLVRQITSPVRWSESCIWMGSQYSGPYHELAPGRVLTGLMRRINREIKVESHDRPNSD